MIDAKSVERRRLALCRMAGNIATGLYASSFLSEESERKIVEWSVDIAERIMNLVNERHPLPEREDLL